MDWVVDVIVFLARAILWIAVILFVVAGGVGWPLLLYAKRKERDAEDKAPKPKWQTDWDGMFGGAYDYGTRRPEPIPPEEQKIFDTETGTWEPRSSLDYTI